MKVQLDLDTSKKIAISLLFLFQCISVGHLSDLIQTMSLRSVGLSGSDDSICFSVSGEARKKKLDETRCES